MLDDMLALANSVYLLALSRSGRHVLALLLCAGLSLAVLCLLLEDNMLVRITKKPTKKALLARRGEEGKGSPASNRRRRCSSGRFERPERCQ